MCKLSSKSEANPEEVLIRNSLPWSNIYQFQTTSNRLTGKLTTSERKDKPWPPLSLGLLSRGKVFSLPSALCSNHRRVFSLGNRSTFLRLNFPRLHTRVIQRYWLPKVLGYPRPAMELELSGTRIYCTDWLDFRASAGPFPEAYHRSRPSKLRPHSSVPVLPVLPWPIAGQNNRLSPTGLYLPCAGSVQFTHGNDSWPRHFLTTY